MTTLLPDVEAFLAANPTISATRFGNDALADRHFVRQLRAGRRVWPETERKVRAFMSNISMSSVGSNHSQADTAAPQQPSPGKVGEDFRAVQA